MRSHSSSDKPFANSTKCWPPMATCSCRFISGSSHCESSKPAMSQRFMRKRRASYERPLFPKVTCFLHSKWGLSQSIWSLHVPPHPIISSRELRMGASVQLPLPHCSPTLLLALRRPEASGGGGGGGAAAVSGPRPSGASSSSAATSGAATGGSLPGASPCGGSSSGAGAPPCGGSSSGPRP